MRRWKRLSGFTLLEMSIVLSVIAIVTAAGLTMFTASLQKRQMMETQTKLKAIQKALYDFRIANSRLPCPADITLVVTDANFGTEGATTGTCAGGSPAANFVNGNYVEGMVPIQTLRLPDDYAMDGWGRRIMYAVDKRFTATSALTVYTPVAGPMSGTTHSNTTVDSVTSVTGLSANMGIYGSGTGATLVIPAADTITGTGANSVTLNTAANSSATITIAFYSSALPSTNIPAVDQLQRMTVKDASGNNKTTRAAYVLISMGANGHGAYPRNGGATRINVGSTNADELTNCDCTNAGASNGVLPAGTFVQKSPTQDTTSLNKSFDDVVAFATRADLRTPLE